jgi:hypothetical protein
MTAPLIPLTEVVRYLADLVVSADGTREAKPLIRGHLLYDPNPFPSAKERHG